MKRAVLLLVTMLLVAHTGRAQPGGRLLEGTVLDATSRQPVPFASIGLLHTALGTVSNAEGGFRLVLPPAQVADSLVVSCLGFASYRAAVASSAGQPLAISLVPQAVALQAAAVVGYTPQTLLKRALRTTHARLLSPALLQSYYREFVQVNGAYTKFADGLVDYRLVTNPRRLYKPDIQVRVAQSRAKVVRVPDSRFQDLPSVIDVAQACNGYERYSDIRSNFLDSTDFAFYHYELREPAGPVEAPYYLVSFTPITHDADHLYQGTVRIDKQTGCFQAVEAEVPAALQPYTTAANLLIIKLKVTAIRKHLDYRQLHGACYLGFVRVEWGADVTVGGEVAKYLLSTEMLVSNVLPAPAPIPGPEQYHGRSLFQHGTHYTYPYWEQATSVAATPAEAAVIAGLNPSE